VLEGFTSPRAAAFALVGLHAYLMRLPGDTAARRMRQLLAGRLFAQFRANSSADWPWCEDVLTYDNAKLPHALILVGKAGNDQQMLEAGLHSLEWLVDLQIPSSGRVSLIGNRGWLDRRGNRARFDQQPVEAMALVEACAEAYRVTGAETWYERARCSLDWFTGNNDTGASLYDPQTGGCRDGLHADGANLNQGAESTLAWLISLLTMMGLHRMRSAEPAGTLAPVAAGENGHGI
jgi:hypothetical protein